MSILKEYKICKQRGHVADGFLSGQDAELGEWQRCKYCGSEFGSKLVQTERKQPRSKIRYKSTEKLFRTGE